MPEAPKATDAHNIADEKVTKITTTTQEGDDKAPSVDAVAAEPSTEDKGFDISATHNIADEKVTKITTTTQEGDDKAPSVDAVAAEPSTEDKGAALPDQTAKKKITDRLLEWLTIFLVIAVPFGFGIAATVYWQPIRSFLVSYLSPEPHYPPSAIEAVFVSQFDNSGRPSDVMDEWREARGDHNSIAHMIADCEGITEISPKIFSSLLLDLTPSGDHRPPLGVTDGGNKPIMLTPYERSILLLSDAIARARVRAAASASGYRPNVTLMGWLTVAVSALATLLITIKSSWTSAPVEPSPLKSDNTTLDESKTSTANTGLSQSTNSTDDLGTKKPQSSTVSTGTDKSKSSNNTLFFTAYGWYVIIGILAMILSAFGTVLASAKAFYDPTRVYVADQRALLGLQGLHREVAYTVMATATSQPVKSNPDQSAGSSQKWCAGSNDANGQLKLGEWSKRLHDLETGRIAASLPVSATELK